MALLLVDHNMLLAVDRLHTLEVTTSNCRQALRLCFAADALSRESVEHFTHAGPETGFVPQYSATYWFQDGGFIQDEFLEGF